MTATTISTTARSASAGPRGSLRTLWLTTLIVAATLAAATLVVLAIVLARGGIEPTYGDAVPRPAPQPTASPGLDL